MQDILGCDSAAVPSFVLALGPGEESAIVPTETTAEP